MSGTGPWTKEMLTLLVKLEQTFNDAYDAGESTLQYYSPLTLTLSSHDEHIATLYEEGWGFSEPPLDKSD